MCPLGHGGSAAAPRRTRSGPTDTVGLVGLPNGHHMPKTAALRWCVHGHDLSSMEVRFELSPNIEELLALFRQNAPASEYLQPFLTEC